jgi:hypothetical protein
MRITLKDDDVQFLFMKLRKIVENSETFPEMTFRVRVEQWLHTFFELKYNVNLTNYGVHDSQELGPIKLRGQPDAIYGGLIIDYKAVGELVNEKNREIIIEDFRNKYLEPIPETMRTFFKGVIFDGKMIIFLEWQDNKWAMYIENFTEKSLRKLLELLIQYLNINPSSGNLIKTFSLNKSCTKKLLRTLYIKLKEALEQNNQTVKASFEQWHDMFMFLYGSVLSGEKIKADFSEFAEDIIKDRHAEVPYFLFVLFTYYMQIVTLICAEILCACWNKPSISKILISSQKLKEELEYLFRGDFFRKQFNIGNFTEDLHNFSWFLDVWDKSVEEAIKPIIENTSRFNFLLLTGLFARDVLRGLYEGIVPEQIRHDLGEVFTPDWLVELTLNEVGFYGNLDHKLLDPGCGRGVFLAEAISRVIRKNREKVNDDIILRKILNNIVGFDINPIAVITARTNYLIALSPLLPSLCKIDNPVIIPIFTTDSILTPTTEDIEPSTTITYKISTTKGVLRLPKIYVEGPNLKKTIQLLNSFYTYELINKKELIKSNFPQASERDINVFVEFIKKLSELDSYERNTIITYIKSFFAPLEYLNSFDFVVGNPPWIKWEFLAKEYKKKLSVLYLKVYKLFSYGGMKAGMGYAHDDISIVFSYVALDKYLKNGGKFAFLLKQTLYKSIAGKEFRKFCIDKITGKVPLKVIRVHDLVDIKPFQPIQSETSLIIMEKGNKTSYPVPYFIWKMKDNKSPTEISEDTPLSKVLELVDVIENEAYPDPSLQDNTAPWIIVPKGTKPEVLVTLSNPYDVRHGIVDDLDQVFQVEIVKKEDLSNLLIIKNSVSGRRKVGQRTWKVEQDLIYPLLKPKYIKRWKILGYDYVILPQRKYGENNEEELKAKYPFTYAYLANFKSELLKRTSRWFKNKPFFTVFGLGEYTFKPWKVVWSAIGYLPEFAVAGTVKDSFLGEKVLIPDNTIGFIPLDSMDEAYFVCGLLNSSFIKSIIASKSTKSKWGVSIQLIKQLPLPKYNPQNDLHKKLSQLAMLASQLAHKNELNILSEIEREIDNLAEVIIRKAQQIQAKTKMNFYVQ